MPLYRQDSKEGQISVASQYRTPAGVELTDDLVAEVRKDFPILDRTVNDQPLIYLDTGATSQNPLQVLDAERNYYLGANSAVHRGAHTLAVDATDAFEDARRTVAGFLGAAENELVWTSNATEALNLLAYSLGNASDGIGAEAARAFALKPGDEIITTEQEHHANIIPWQILAARTGATLRYVPVTADGLIDYQAAENIVTERTRVLAFTHVSNVAGSMTDVAFMVQLAERVGALTVLDACQSAPHMQVDVKALGVDFAVFSAHKMLAPTGIGALYGRHELLEALPPFLTGGSMITKVTMTEAEWMPAPIKFEAGTQRVSQAVAWAEAVRYLQHLGMDRVHAWEAHLGQLLAEGVSQIPGVRLLGPSVGQPRAGLVSVHVDGVHPHDVGQLLDQQGIAVRVGHHCAQPLHRALGVTASTRASAYIYTSTQDVERFIEELAKVRPYFGYTD